MFPKTSVLYRIVDLLTMLKWLPCPGDCVYTVTVSSGGYVEVKYDSVSLCDVTNDEFRTAIEGGRWQDVAVLIANVVKAQYPECSEELEDFVQIDWNVQMLQEGQLRG